VASWQTTEKSALSKKVRLSILGNLLLFPDILHKE